MANNPTIKVDPAGDLILLVDTHNRRTIFQVSSKAMSLASPVWRTMLDAGGPFRESTPDKGEVTFQDDDTNGLMILLLAAHLRFKEVPQTLKYQQLLDLCIVCDKYDCIDLVRPWISGWESSIMSLAQYVGRESSLMSLAQCVGHEEWLFIAWTIGDIATFEQVARKIVKESTTNESKECLTASKKILDQAMPPGITDGILKARLETLAALIKACHHLVDVYGRRRYLDGVSATTEVFNCAATTNQHHCDTLVFGSLVRQLQVLQLWPGVPSDIASSYTKSVTQLSAEIRAIKCLAYPSQSYRDGHERCGFSAKLEAGVRDILATMPSGMQESHQKHMETQHQKLSHSDILWNQLHRPAASPSR